MKVSDTVTGLLGQLQVLELPYAVLRNYEELPFVRNDLDIVLEKSAITKLKGVLLSQASKNGWDFCVEVSSLESRSYCTSLKIFFLFSLIEKHPFQLDVFGGGHVAKQKLFSAEELISRRELYRNFYKISCYDEALLRLLAWSNQFRLKQHWKLDKIRGLLPDEQAFYSFAHYVQQSTGLNLSITYQQLLDSPEEIAQAMKRFKKLYWLKKSGIKGAAFSLLDIASKRYKLYEFYKIKNKLFSDWEKSVRFGLSIGEASKNLETLGKVYICKEY